MDSMTRMIWITREQELQRVERDPAVQHRISLEREQARERAARGKRRQASVIRWLRARRPRRAAAIRAAGR